MILNGLPTKEFFDLVATYKAEIKTMSEKLIEGFGRKS